MLGGGLLGCTLTTASPATPRTPPTSTPEPDMLSETPASSAPRPTPSTLPPLRTHTGPYTDHTGLLAGVCFEYLASIAGETWQWRTADDVRAFFDRARRTDLCLDPIPDSAPVEERLHADDDVIWLGTVQIVSGCDAAYELADSLADFNQPTNRIIVVLRVRGACSYDLVEPLLIAVPVLTVDAPPELIVHLP